MGTIWDKFFSWVFHFLHSNWTKFLNFLIHHNLNLNVGISYLIQSRTLNELLRSAVDIKFIEKAQIRFNSGLWFVSFKSESWQTLLLFNNALIDAIQTQKCKHNLHVIDRGLVESLYQQDHISNDYKNGIEWGSTKQNVHLSQGKIPGLPLQFFKSKFNTICFLSLHSITLANPNEVLPKASQNVDERTEKAIFLNKKVLPSNQSL